MKTITMTWNPTGPAPEFPQKCIHCLAPVTKPYAFTFGTKRINLPYCDEHKALAEKITTLHKKLLTPPGIFNLLGWGIGILVFVLILAALPGDMDSFMQGFFLLIAAGLGFFLRKLTTEGLTYLFMVWPDQRRLGIKFNDIKTSLGLQMSTVQGQNATLLKLDFDNDEYGALFESARMEEYSANS
jgi:hypothetical protein